jgi:hypothetical protein
MSLEAVAPFLEVITDLDRLGILTAGGPQHVGPGWRFLERSWDAGPSMVNPLAFPATLASSIPTALAAAIGARAFALTIGHDDLAVLQALDRACALIRSSHADDVFVVVGSDYDPQLIRLWGTTTGEDEAADYVSAFHVSGIKLAGSCRLALVDSGSEREPSAANPSMQQDTLTLLKEIVAGIENVRNVGGKGCVTVVHPNCGRYVRLESL